MTSYYNEIDPLAAEWTRALIKAGAIPEGVVDERSIEDVLPDELADFHHVHFFSGIGGWAYALRLAGWPDDRPVWSGSCPCQSFSSAGKGRGFDDPRHLWPAMFWLVSQCRPSTVFGEQTSSRLALSWWDLVASDLEGAGYAAAAVDLPAASIGAPHRRNRLFWLAHSASQQGRKGESRSSSFGETGEWRQGAEGAGERGTSGFVADAASRQRERSRSPRGGRCRPSNDRLDNHWEGVDWIDCLDEKQRPVKPGICLLADGISGRVGRIRGYGNAIVPQLAAKFIEACEEII